MNKIMFLVTLVLAVVLRIGEAQAIDGLQYIASYPDLIRAFGANAAAGEQHFLTYGQAEGRSPDAFNEAQYLANYPELQAAFGANTLAATIHYIQYGFAEGRTDRSLIAQARPDIVILLADDLGATDIGPVQRRVAVATPNIDAIAAGGITFTSGYGAPACVQARAMLMAGKWQHRRSLGPINANGPPPPGSMVTIAERLRSMGYATALVGKWHLGFSGGMHPLDQGFDTFFGFKGTTPNYFGDDPKAPEYRQRTQIRNTGSVTDTLGAEPVQLLSDPARTKPLFLFLAWTAPHNPLQGTLAQRIAEIDANTGRVVAAARPNTLFFWAGDNGRGTNNPFRGGKYDILEGGVRVPLALRWDRHVEPGQVIATPASLIDIAATAVAAAGGTLRDTDGYDLLAPVPAERPVFFKAMDQEPGFAVRRGPWKLYLNYKGVAQALYNVDANPNESLNVAAGNQDTVVELSLLISQFKSALND